MRKIEVVPYDALWPLLFDIEVEKLLGVLSHEILAIYHIGSTSVDGLYAKPVIDIMPVVRNISRIDRFTSGMEPLGYEGKGENGIVGRRFFMKGGDDRTHHVHIFEVGSPHIKRHLAFRDYLRQHPRTAEHYSSLKLDLAAHFPDDMDAYIDGKNRFVQETEQKALAWYRQKGSSQG
ncbi:GrpB family protein [Lentibacillus salinarum]|uniref:GrpB family protein n=1 Tax=Lentibacillus salinarum TaxID=446820 RepID=A0ABW3ZTY7_9BACI